MLDPLHKIPFCWRESYKFADHCVVFHIFHVAFKFIVGYDESRLLSGPWKELTAHMVLLLSPEDRRSFSMAILCSPRTFFVSYYILVGGDLPPPLSWCSSCMSALPFVVVELWFSYGVQACNIKLLRTLVGLGNLSVRAHPYNIFSKF